MVKLLAIMTTILSVAACGYGAHFEDCTVWCVESGCPDGMTCGGEGLCRPPNAIGACGGGNVQDGGALDGSTACQSPSGSDTDLALMKPASADQIANSTYAASKANDGDDGTSWNAGDATSGHWWLVDLGADHLLTSLNTLWEYNDIHYYQYAVSISSDGTNFATAIDETADTRTARARTDTFPAATCARYVRIKKTDNTGYWAILFTVNVMGR